MALVNEHFLKLAIFTIAKYRSDSNRALVLIVSFFATFNTIYEIFTQTQQAFHSIPSLLLYTDNSPDC